LHRSGFGDEARGIAKPREEVEDGVFHVYARGNDKRLVFHDELDRRMYLRMLRSAVEDYRWRLLAYCLMNNQVLRLRGAHMGA
jgi:REP element-mobilizing transposase RayT